MTSGPRKWLAGARPQTLPASIVPVLVGTAAAGPALRADRAALAILVGLAIQIGANYANDYSDGIRGTDRNRTGPARLVASGAATPTAVLRAALIAFGVAIVAGVALAWPVNPWLLVPGFASIVAAWYYTGGRRPYGYSGYGELWCFVFFGPVATLGATYVQHGALTPISLWASVAVGALTTALLVANNLRDIPGDAANGKRTLAVKLGDRATRRLYLVLLAAAALATLAVVLDRPWVMLAFVAAAVAIRPVRTVCAGATGRALVPVLIDTGRLELVFGAIFALTVQLPPH